MSARYTELLAGVHDNQLNVDVTPANQEAWKAYHVWLAAGNEPDAQAPPVQPPINQRRAEVKARIDNFRLQKFIGRPPVTYQGHTYACDDRTLKFLQDVVQALSLGATMPPSFTWRTTDGIDVNMTATQVQTLVKTMLLRNLQRDYQVFQNEWALHAQVDASANPTTIDITAGWPA